MTEGYYKVEGEAKNLLEENWDVLIILDACRYDYFKDLYGNYLDGNVKKAISPATTTMDWLNKVFPDFYDDIVYISANPFINSKIEVKDKYGLRFNGKKYFFKIIDVWKGGWDNQLETTPPSNVNKALFRLKANYTNKRFIVHYMQPHAPYISKNYASYIPSMRSVEEIFVINMKGGQKKYTNVNIRTLGRKVIQKTLGLEVAWKIGRLLKLPIDSQVGAIGYKEGLKGLRNAYKENLEVVLGSVAELVKNVSGNILITADHGEYLGENRRYGHGLLWPRRPPNTEVPWLIIEKNKSAQGFERENYEKMLIRERIKNLKSKRKI